MAGEDIELGQIGSAQPQRDSRRSRNQNRETRPAEPEEYFALLLKIIYVVLLVALGICAFITLLWLLYFLGYSILHFWELTPWAHLSGKRGFLIPREPENTLQDNVSSATQALPTFTPAPGLFVIPHIDTVSNEIWTASPFPTSPIPKTFASRQHSTGPFIYHHAYPIHRARPIDMIAYFQYRVAFQQCGTHLLQWSKGENMHVTRSLEFALHNCKSAIDGAIEDLFMGSLNMEQVSKTVSNGVRMGVSDPPMPSMRKVLRDLTNTPEISVSALITSRRPLYTPNWLSGRACTPAAYCGWVNSPNGLDRCMYRNVTHSAESEMDDYVNKTADDFRIDAPEECNFCLPEVSLDDLEQYCVDVARAEEKAMKFLLQFAAAIVGIAMLGPLLRCFWWRWRKTRKNNDALWRRPGVMGFDGVGDESVSIRGMLNDGPDHPTRPMLRPFLSKKSVSPQVYSQAQSSWFETLKQAQLKTWRVSLENLSGGNPPHPVFLDGHLAESTNHRRTGMGNLITKWFRPGKERGQVINLNDYVNPRVKPKRGNENRIPVIPPALTQAQITSANGSGAQTHSDIRKRMASSQLKGKSVNKSGTGKNSMYGLRVPVTPYAIHGDKFLRPSECHVGTSSESVQVNTTSLSANSDTNKYEPKRRNSLALSLQKTPPEMYGTTEEGMVSSENSDDYSCGQSRSDHGHESASTDSQSSGRVSYPEISEIVLSEASMVNLGLWRKAGSAKLVPGSREVQEEP